MAQTLHEAFRAQTRRAGDHAALIDGSRVMSYAELDERSDRAAAWLADCGVGLGDRVALLLPRSAELVVAIIGILKAGAAYSALDPSWPAARARTLTERLRPALVVTEPIAGLAMGKVTVAVTGDDAAAVVFTSGTTGRPQAIVSPHQGIVRLFPRCGAADFTGGPVVTLSASLSWDGFTLELWGALCSGGTAVVVPEPFLLPARLRQLVDEHAVDTAFLATSLFALHVDEGLDAFTGLRRVLTGGEPMPLDHARRFLLRHPAVDLVDCYGPAECCVLTTTHQIRLGDCVAGDIPIGLPAPGTDVRVIDGEIHVAGAGLAMEYLDDPETTARKFVLVDGVRTYRSGDRGEWGPDGLLRYRGRDDRQVKVRGHRVEPAEIEAAADGLSEVSRSVVVSAGAELELFYQGPGAVDEVQAKLRALLPAYLTPRRLTRVPAFPLGSNGKVDRDALLALIGSETTVLPAVPAADPVIMAFAETLRLAAPSAATSFFDLGGTSLDAGRLCVRLGAELGVTIPISAVFANPSAEELSAWVRGHAQESSPAPVDGPVPLLPSQVGFFLAGQRDPDDLSILCPLVWEIEGDIHPGPMREALADLASRHEALSSRYTIEDTPVSVPVPGAAVELSLCDDVMKALMRRLDLEHGQVWRAAIAPGHFGMAVHHVALDARAATVLAGDLSVAYQARLRGAAPRFPHPAPGLVDIAHAYHRQLRTTDLKRQRDYWRQALADLPETPWGAAEPRNSRIEVAERELPLTVLDEVVSRRGGTRATVLLAAFARAVADLTGATDLAVGVPVARRNDPVFAHAVTCAIDMLCVRLRARDLAGVTAAVAEAMGHSDVALHEAVRLARRREPYQCVVVVQDEPEPLLDLPGAVARFGWADSPQLDVPVLVEQLPRALRVSCAREGLAGDLCAAVVESLGELT